MSFLCATGSFSVNLLHRLSAVYCFSVQCRMSFRLYSWQMSHLCHGATSQNHPQLLQTHTHSLFLDDIIEIQEENGKKHKLDCNFQICVMLSGMRSCGESTIRKVFDHL